MTWTRRHTQVVAGAIALLALIAAGYAWWTHTYQRTEEWVDLPRTGEAARNPLYVLKLALRADAVQTQARPRLQRAQVALGARDTVLLYNDPRTLSKADARALLDWVAGGGHLLVRTPPPGPLDIDAPIPLLDEMGVAARNEGGECAGLDVHGEEGHVEFCNARRFELSDDAPLATLRWGDAERGYVFARLPHGAGVVDVVGDFEYLGNDSLKEGPHIALARQLLAPNYRAGVVHLIYAAQAPSFWMSLARNSWMAWGPLLLALLAWLWRRSQRFGPLLPTPAVERRSLLEHITASGEHIYRYGYAHVLHEAARNAFLARLRRRDPQAAALQGDAQAALLADRFDLPAADIRAALSTPIARDHAAFRTRVALLLRMRNSLRTRESTP